MEKNNDDEKYPGYPHYPASEDITEHGNNNGEQPLDQENIAATNKNDYLNEDGTDIRFVSGTDDDVTKDDLKMLDAAEQNMNTTDDISLQAASLDNTDEDGDPLNEEGSLDEDMTGEDLDVPGSGDDDADEIIGEEDEENNYYSLGGDLHED